MRVLRVTAKSRVSLGNDKKVRELIVVMVESSMNWLKATELHTWNCMMYERCLHKAFKKKKETWHFNRGHRWVVKLTLPYLLCSVFHKGQVLLLSSVKKEVIFKNSVKTNASSILIFYKAGNIHTSVRVRFSPATTPPRLGFSALRVLSCTLSHMSSTVSVS